MLYPSLKACTQSRAASNVAKPWRGKPGEYFKVRNRASAPRLRAGQAPGVVVADTRTAEGRGDTEPAQQGLDGRALERAAVIAVQHPGGCQATCRLIIKPL